MKTQELLKTLNQLDKRGLWLFSFSDLELLFPGTKARGLYSSLARHSASGLIQQVGTGLYINPNATCLPAEPLMHIALALRPLEFNYLSLESVLAENNVISQMPSRLTFMSTGASKTVTCPLGTIEYVRTQRRDIQSEPGIITESGRGAPVATVAVAYRDLLRCGRSLDLVDQDNLKEAIADQAAALLPT